MKKHYLELDKLIKEHELNKAHCQHSLSWITDRLEYLWNNRYLTIDQFNELWDRLIKLYVAILF